MKPRKPNARVTMPMVARMRDLRGAGLSYTAIAAVVRLDFGEAPCEKTIRRYAGSPSPHGAGCACMAKASNARHWAAA